MTRANSATGVIKGPQSAPALLPWTKTTGLPDWGPPIRTGLRVPSTATTRDSQSIEGLWEVSLPRSFWLPT